MAKILMMSANVATLDLLEIKIFWNKSYDVKISVYDVTIEILLRDFFLPEKPLFLKGGLGSSSIIWDWH